MRGDTMRSLSESGLRSIIDTSHRARIKKHHVHRFVYIALITVYECHRDRLTANASSNTYRLIPVALHATGESKERHDW